MNTNELSFLALGFILVGCWIFYYFWLEVGFLALAFHSFITLIATACFVYFFYKSMDEAKKRMTKKLYSFDPKSDMLMEKGK